MTLGELEASLAAIDAQLAKPPAAVDRTNLLFERQAVVIALGTHTAEIAQREQGAGKAAAAAAAAAQAREHQRVGQAAGQSAAASSAAVEAAEHQRAGQAAGQSAAASSAAVEGQARSKKHGDEMER
jgi:hypothetical protein